MSSKRFEEDAATTRRSHLHARISRGPLEHREGGDARKEGNQSIFDCSFTRLSAPCQLGCSPIAAKADRSRPFSRRLISANHGKKERAQDLHPASLTYGTLQPRPLNPPTCQFFDQQYAEEMSKGGTKKRA